MSNGKGQIELAKERLVKAVNQVLGVIRRKGRSRKVELALVFMTLLGGRTSVKNAAETFGLDYANLLEALGELHDAWRDYLKVLSGLVKGEVAVIIDDTVDHKEYSRGKDVSPHGRLLDLLPCPPEVREGQAPHGRHSRPLHGQGVHGGSLPLRREEDVGFGDGQRVQDQDRLGQGDIGRAQGALQRVHGSLRLMVLVGEAREGQRGV
jgi:hypothetical protein